MNWEKNFWALAWIGVSIVVAVILDFLLEAPCRNLSSFDWVTHRLLLAAFGACIAWFHAKHRSSVGFLVLVLMIFLVEGLNDTCTMCLAGLNFPQATIHELSYAVVGMVTMYFLYAKKNLEDKVDFATD